MTSHIRYAASGPHHGWRASNRSRGYDVKEANFRRPNFGPPPMKTTIRQVTSRRGRNMKVSLAPISGGEK